MRSVSEICPYMAYGGDYNPEQWSEEVWLEDARLMQQAGVNLVSVGIFSWSVIELNENQFDFSWLDRIMNILHDHGIGVSLATATASTPAWFVQKYPDSVAVDRQGVPYSFGSRQHYSPCSPEYIQGVKRIVRQLADRYKDHPALKMWHINNEYACHMAECYSAHTEKAFRVWLQETYGTIDKLNEKWGTAFWSQRYNDFEEITLPRHTPTFTNPGQTLDYKRFMNDRFLYLYKIEKDILREVTPDVPVFTNFMYQFKPLNYWQWAKELDVVTWDSYPDPLEGTPSVSHTMWHDLMRSLKQGQPFLLMEQCTGQVNWMDVNVIKPPGVMRLQSYAAIAHGADGIMFFQWRQSRAGAEKFHGAMLPLSGGEESRIFKEVTQLGQELKNLDPVVGARTKASVAIVFDWENWWAVEQEGKPHQHQRYIQQVMLYYQAFYQRHIAVDFVRAQDDLSPYQIVVAPQLYMLKEGEAQNLEQFVSQGGTLIVTFFSAIVDENDRFHLTGYGGPLRDVLGLWVEEFDPYPVGAKNRLHYEDKQAWCYTWSDVIHLDGAKTLAAFGENWYKGYPAVTLNTYGQGQALYIGTEPDPSYIDELVGTVLEEKEIRAPLDVPPNVEVQERHTASDRFIFVLNYHQEAVHIRIPEGQPYTDLITQKVVKDHFPLQGWDVAVLQQRK
ncbi:beta-galactosidase [Caldalkalibacillus salinus]|uniref:beta-galactosidase n=1 Tax=Caldalkalibacillus salinus TaxID=2803787 RepID=UPI0019215310|nr:beta-galactosidase [Caldalkalibacillus salinus]